MADIIATLEKNIPLSSEPDVSNAGKTWYALDSKICYTADATGKVFQNPYINAIVSEKSKSKA
jgi:hypothetical protein